MIALVAALLAAGLEAHGSEPPTGRPAGTVLVTAGEHGAFSRVVFALGADLAYRAEPEPAGLRVVFPDARVAFDYAGVYPERRAHRVVMAEADLAADGASLRLRFGCDCSARTFMLDGRLVVDVFDAAAGGNQPPASHTAPADRAAPPPAAARSEAAATDRAAGQGPVAASDQGSPRPEFLQRVESLDSPAPGTRHDSAPDGAGFDADHLQRMIAWAIEQGHLTGTAESRPETAPDGQLAGGEPTAEPPRATEPPAAPAQSAVAQQLPLPPEPAPPPEEAAAGADAGDACPDEAGLDMAALAGTGPFAAELSRRQEALSQALAAGHGIAAAQDALAGFYLARLMPHEALQLLRSEDRDPTPTGSWLEAAAAVLAHRPGTPAARTLQAASCGGADIALWRAVLRAADGPLPRQTVENAAIALRLASYPPALRVELALRLAEAGIHAKAPDAVARLLDVAAQAAPADQARARLLYLRGRLAAARGDFAGARASWRDALQLPGEGGLRATLALLGSELEDGGLDEAEALELLERLAYDWRGHPVQLSIARLTAAIHERHGRVAPALRAIEEVALGAEGRPGGRAAARLATDLMRRAYADATALSVDDLAVFWRYEGFVPPGAEGADLRLAFARAMLAHGLPNAAVALLEPLARRPSGPPREDVVELLAEAYVAARQPASALDLLRAPATPAAAARPGRNLLAARALAALGRFAEAAGVLDGNPGAGVAQRQADYLWKAGLWQEASAAYRDLLQVSEAQTDPESAERLAAAAYMTGYTVRPGPAPATAGAGAAFAPLPAPDRSPGRSGAAQLLDQAAALSDLAERYGLGGPAP